MTGYSKKRHIWHDKILYKLGRKLYLEIFGNCKAQPVKDKALDFEGIDIMVTLLNGRRIYVSDRFRPAISKYGHSELNLCDMNDITIRTKNKNGKPLEISHMSPHYFIYAVVNEEETDFCRWYLIDIQRLLKLYYAMNLEPNQEHQNDDGNWFAVFDVDVLRKFNLIKKEKNGEKATLQQTIDGWDIDKEPKIFYFRG